MKKKNHDRSPDKRNFSVALPITLIEELTRIADEETRSRNGQIEKFLEESIRLYKAKNMLSVVDGEQGNERKAK